jgi:hypothetical protein
MAHINLEKILKKRSKLLLDFFFRVKGWSILVCFILFGIGCLVSYYTLDSEYNLAHLISGCVTAFLFLAFLLSILRLFEKNITREELEAVIAYDRSIAYDQLFKNLSIENIKSRYQTDPIEIVCPEVYPKRKTIVYRYFENDSKVFYSQIGYSWLFFGEKSLYYYHSSVNHIYGYVGHENSCEFDYSDIVSISTSTTHVNEVESLVLTLSLVNGETLDIALRTRPNHYYGSTHELSQKEAYLLSTIRNIIRKSK